MIPKSEIIDRIRSSFNGVALDGGTSLKQLLVIDNYGRDCSDSDFLALPRSEITDDWQRILSSDLDKADALSHLDRKGFKYYIPALMIRLLENYDPRSMMTIGTLSVLYPKTDSWPFLYTLLSDEQLHTIAVYLYGLPDLLQLEGEDIPVVDRAFRNYWSRHY